jgi:hypothetical protein
MIPRTISLRAVRQVASCLARSALLAPLLLLASAGKTWAGNVNETNGVALKGYDPVAYFAEQKAVPGSEGVTLQHEGATYRFASEANRETFKKSPDKYLPQYGGFCAYGVAGGYKADVDPQAFSVLDGKLYLNYNQQIQAEWKKDTTGYIKTADGKWPTVSETTKVHR